MTTCSIDDCSLEVYEDSSNCILHCEKSAYPQDFHKIGFLSSFYKELILFIVEQEFSYKSETSEFNKSNLEEFLKGNDNESTSDHLNKDIKVAFSNIVYPSRDSRDSFDYLNLLKKLGAIHFDSCQFHVYGLDLGDIRCFYQDCVFHDRWSIYNSPILENDNSVLYQCCTFNKSVSTYTTDKGKRKIDSQLFNNCNFQKGIEFESVVFNAPIFNNTDDMDLHLESIRLLDCEVKDKFILNHCKIGLFKLEDSLIESKFEFKSNVVKIFQIFNTNFSKVVDTYETKFTKFNLEKSIFEDFVGFEKCLFGYANEANDDLVAKFTYATFLSFINFRNTRFVSGLDIENINLKEAPNFLKSQINAKYCNRETFRIIKSSFDKTGNYIEANKYFAHEMQKYKEELKGTNRTQEKLILFLNEKISNYGQSYIRPIIYMLVTSIIYYILILGYEQNVVYEIHPGINGVLNIFSSILNRVAVNILPFSKFLKEGMEFISLIFYIVYASLIWQTLVAVKRHTRR
ncbi:hypothetical protein [Candidatus Nitrotoga sp. M5]|uniref:hypothetical protein n=1 Tax=Candidatus Nitrotoga sp. M5 TaxID=2890409 RepID=UPI001EF28D7E|nr:hypothetical protein [Candidatus Nitrotoga sp. M5]CAH1385426.1 conserved membrane hypothetical protein [Candidatus Nitrotoga sp. M5]